MSLEAAFVAHVNDCEALTSFVGSRVYEEIAEQDSALPYITYQIVSSNRDAYSLDGANGQVESRLQVSCWAASGVKRRQLADTLRMAVDGYRGFWNGTEIQSVFIDADEAAFEASAENEQSRAWGWRFDLLITHVENVPRFS